MIAVLIDKKGFQSTQQLPVPMPAIYIPVYNSLKWYRPDADLEEVLKEPTVTKLVFERRRKLLDDPVEIWEYREA